MSWFDEIIDQNLRKTYDVPLFEYAFNHLNDANHSVDDLFFVGHSLGGTIAEIVAAQLHGVQKRGHLDGTQGADTSMRSFAFSAPGLLLNSRKFSVNIADLHETATIINAEHDLLVGVDEHVGLLQDIDCVFEDIWYGCHTIQNAICTLYEHCDANQSHHPEMLAAFCDYDAAATM